MKLFRKYALLIPILVSIVALSGCASARGLAITADQEFATAVFAVDDAEYQSWQAHLLSDEQHARLNPLIVKALQDVKAVTAAIKAAPQGVPNSLPLLLQDLERLQVAIQATEPIIPALASAASAADMKAIALLSHLVGGQ